MVRFESDDNGHSMPPGVYKLTYNTVAYYASKEQQVSYGQAEVNLYSVSTQQFILFQVIVPLKPWPRPVTVRLLLDKDSYQVKRYEEEHDMRVRSKRAAVAQPLDSFWLI